MLLPLLTPYPRPNRFSMPSMVMAIVQCLTSCVFAYLGACGFMVAYALVRTPRPPRRSARPCPPAPNPARATGGQPNSPTQSAQPPHSHLTTPRQLRYRSLEMAWFTSVAFYIMSLYITQVCLFVCTRIVCCCTYVYAQGGGGLYTMPPCPPRNCV